MRAIVSILGLLAVHYASSEALLVKKTGTSGLANHRKQVVSRSKLYLSPSDSASSQKAPMPMHITALAATQKSTAVAEKQETLKDRLEVFFYITLWYILSMGYNVYNKKAMNTLKLPWFVACIQMVSLWFDRRISS